MAEQIFSSIPWLVLLVVFVGEKIQQWMITRALDRALQRAQGEPVRNTGPAPSPPAPIQSPIPAPKPASPFAAAPGWFRRAMHEVGFRETGNNRGISRYVEMAHCGAEGDPWCAIFANAMLEASGIPGTRSPSSQSFRTHPAFVQLSSPAVGCIVVFWRISKTSGQGHVGFYRGEDAGHIWTLGGNEGDMVQIEALPKDSPTFGLIGYWWPRSVPLPNGGAIMMPAGSPVSIKTVSPSLEPSKPGKQVNIVATVFGGQKSAYGPAINDSQLGVALPFRFEGERPQVRLTRGDKSVVCDIVDVGPWNSRDPYWQTGSRPQAETGTDLSGRRTNKAGIDLTVAAAQALGVDGKGLVSWEFVEGPLVPKVT